MGTEELLGAIAATGVIGMIAGYLAWQWGFFHHKVEHPFPKFSILFVVGAYALYLGVQLYLAPALIVFGYALAGAQLGRDEVSNVAYSIIAMVMGGGAVIALCVKQLQPVFKGKGKEFFLGAATWFVAAPIAFFMGQCIEWILLVGWGLDYEHQVAVQQLKVVADHPWLLTLMIGVVLLLAPLVEEILFRGVLYSWLRHRLGVFGTLVVTSIVFSFFHFSVSQGWSNLQLISSLFVLSCFLGWLYERERSLWAPIGLHFMFNFVGVVIVLSSN